MKKTSPSQAPQSIFFIVVVCLLVVILAVPMVSAVWWNPFTWGNSQTEIIKGERWIEVFSDNPDFYTVIPDNSKHDADIYLCSKTATKKNDLLDLDFATSFKAEAKELKTKEKLKAIEYNEAYCYYYKPTKDEKFLKFDKHSTHLVYTNESIIASNDDGVVSELSLITPDYNYKNGKPNKNTGFGDNLLVHTFHVTNYSSDAITNLRAIDMNSGQEVERNIKIMSLTYEEVNVPTYERVCSIAVNGTEVCENVINGYENVMREKWIDFIGVEEWDYTLGIFADVKNKDYVDIDFDFYGYSVADSPVDWATWTAGLNTDLLAYWKLDELSGTIYDSTANNVDSTDNTADYGASGKINYSLDFERSNGDYTTFGDLTAFEFAGTDPFSISVWVKLESTSVAHWFVSKQLSTATNYGWEFGYDSSNRLFAFMNTAGGEIGARKTGLGLSTGTWYNIVMLKNATAGGNGFDFYVNGVQQSPDAVFGAAATTTDVAVDLQFGRRGTGSGGYYDGLLDEVGIWSRELSPTEVTTLYNGGTGITWTDQFGNAPVVTLTSPANTTNFTISNTVNFQFDVTDAEEVDNITLFINGASEYVNTSGVNGTYYYSTGLEDGYYNWSVIAIDNESTSTTSETWFFNVSYQAGIEIILNTPTANQNFTTTEVTFNADVTDNFGVENVSLFIDGSLNDTDTSGVNGTYEWTLDFADGVHTWYLEVYDNDSNGVNSSTRTFTIHTTPPIVEATEPTGSLGRFVLGDNETLTYNITSDYLDTCWYIYNSIATELNCSSTTTQFVYYPGENSLTVFANDTYGLINNATTSWTYDLIENSLDYEATVLELTATDFSYNFTYVPGDWSSTTVILSYDGTNHTVTDYIGITTREYTETLGLPSVSGEEDKTFQWFVRLTNATGTYIYSSDTYNQTVTDIQLLDCSIAPYVIFNLTLKDEETGADLIGSIDTNIELYSEGSPEDIISFSYNVSGVSNWAICWNNSLENQSLIVNGKWKYYASNHNIEYYNIRNYEANSSTLNQSISFYDLNSSVATIFQITYKGESFLPEDNALIVIAREFVSEGGFKTVEIPITDTDGKTTASLVKDTAVYNFYVYKDGELLATFQNVIPVCANELTGECNINLNAASSTIGIDDFSETDDMNHIVTYNEETRTIETSYSTISGVSSIILMTVVLFDGYENETICSEDVTSSSGSLSCVIPESYVNKTVTVRIYKDGVFVASYIISLKQDPSDFFGYTGYFLAFIMIVMIPFMFVTSIVGVVVGMLIGVALIGLLLLSSGVGIATIGGSMAWLVVACAVLLYKLNEGRN